MATYRSGTERAAALDGSRAAAHESLRAAVHAGAEGSDEAVYWSCGVATDVQKTWRRHGWTPPSELPEYQAKWDACQQPTRIR